MTSSRGFCLLQYPVISQPTSYSSYCEASFFERRYYQMFKLKSNHIIDFEFEKYADLNDSQLEDQAREHGLVNYNSWMLPQIAHYYGNWKLVYVNKLIDPLLTARQNIESDYDIGLWRVVTRLKRSSLVKSQVDPEFASYSALVPLILMGAKKYQGVKYSQWNIQLNCPLIDENLCQAMLYQPDESCSHTDMLPDELCYGLGSERLLELRKIGLTIKSGPRAGTQQSPTSAWCLRGMKNTELATVPKLVATMLTQIWVAHPSLRTEYMILDPNNWDVMPEPLVSAAIFNSEVSGKNGKHSSAANKLPWLMEGSLA